ncbi:hypothetical protein NL492_27160, partial [Klebsiella pneumoniae]|nr:hypothetical protein [Klebsiella pneumoniae]
PKPMNPNFNFDGEIFLFIKDVDIFATSNGVLSGDLTSGLSNKVLLLRSGVIWLFVNPRFVSMSVLLVLESKRTFLGLLLAS